ncbi:hypothetical protein J3F84DRAFT_379371 [Trichoderma pleuroticola]
MTRLFCSLLNLLLQQYAFYLFVSFSFFLDSFLETRRNRFLFLDRVKNLDRRAQNAIHYRFLKSPDTSRRIRRPQNWR